MNELTEKSKRKIRPVNWKRRLLIAVSIVVLLLLLAGFYLASTLTVCGCLPPPEYWETATTFELTNDQKRVHLTQTASAATSVPVDRGLKVEATQAATATAVPGR